MNLESYIAQTLENGDGVENAEKEFNLEAIASDLQNAGYFYSDIAAGTEIPSEIFWETVERHAR